MAVSSVGADGSKTDGNGDATASEPPIASATVDASARPLRVINSTTSSSAIAGHAATVLAPTDGWAAVMFAAMLAATPAMKATFAEVRGRRPAVLSSTIAAEATTSSPSTDSGST
jgi:hypothetical protein